MSHDVCISYSSKDRDRILAIDEQFRANGVSVWLDQQCAGRGGRLLAQAL